MTTAELRKMTNVELVAAHANACWHYYNTLNKTASREIDKIEKELLARLERKEAKT